MNRLKELERRVEQLARATNPAPTATVTMQDGSKTELLWCDAAEIVLSGEAVAVESADADTEALLRAMLGKGAVL